jgi:alpha-tubulin suppressor-like RCC1 family protein
MLTNLPDEIQQEMATYLDIPSLCFFASTNKHSLKNAQPELIKRQKELLSYIGLVAKERISIFHTSKNIYVCGNNIYGQLGLGHNSNCSTFTSVTQLPPGAIQQVVAGSTHTLVLTDQGLFACGHNNAGQLGLDLGSIDFTLDPGGYTNTCPTFTLVDPLPPGIILQIAAGYNHTLVLTDQGLYVCGGNAFGQLGLGHQNNCLTFTPVTTLPPGTIQQVVAGLLHTLVLADQGLYACGYNNYGELGLGHNNCCSTFTAVTVPGTILQMAAGDSHTLILPDQGLYACGDNSFGQLGLGHNNNCTTLTPVTQLPPGTIQKVVAGADHTLVLTDKGLFACGDNRVAQLGLGHKNKCSTLTPVSPLLGTIQQVAAGSLHSLIFTDQELYTCGGNRFGQLGLGHTDNHLIFTPIAPSPGIKQIYQQLRHLDNLISFNESKEQTLPPAVELNP